MRILTQIFPGGESRVRVYQKTVKPLGDLPSSGLLDYNAEFQERKKRVYPKNPETGEVVKPGWGMSPRKTEFGTKARRTIKRVAAMMDAEGGFQVAMTFTLPGSTTESYYTLADYSGYVANRLKTWIGDCFPNGAKPELFYVWELQKRGALHIHACVRVVNRSGYLKLKERAKDAWIKILESVESRSGVAMFRRPNGWDHRRNPSKIQVDVQKVRFSLGGYFAKYLSKGSEVYQELIDAGLRPSRWWGCSRSLVRRMKEGTYARLSPELPQNQALEMKSRLDKMSASLSEAEFSYSSKWAFDRTSIYYLNKDECGLLEAYFERVHSEIQCYSLETRMLSRDERMARRFFRQMWRNNDTRLRLAELIGTDTPEWETLVRFTQDEDSVPPSHILQLHNSLEFEDPVDIEHHTCDSTFFVQAELEFRDLPE